MRQMAAELQIQSEYMGQQYLASFYQVLQLGTGTCATPHNLPPLPTSTNPSPVRKGITKKEIPMISVTEERNGERSSHHLKLSTCAR